MTSRYVLAVVLDEGLESRLRSELARRETPVRRLHVVAPARVGLLDWLATADDRARREADGRARRVERSLPRASRVVSEAGETDPVLAVEDALRVFPADEILVVAASETDAGLEASLRRFGLPVERVPPAAARRRRGRVRRLAADVGGGRTAATPAVAFAGVNLFLAGLAVLVAIAVVLALWLL
jgi:hypothetical protein